MARRAIGVLLCLGTLLSCTEGTGISPDRKVDSVSLFRTGVDNSYLAVGDTQRVTLWVYDSARTRILASELRRAPRFESSDTTVVTVSPVDGLVTGRRLGQANITVVVDTFRRSLGVNVFTQPRRLVVLASGDGDVDVNWRASYLGFGTHRLPFERGDLPTCRIRAGQALESCSRDLGRSEDFNLGTVIRRDSTVTVSQVLGDGTLFSGSECLPGAPNGVVQCFMYRAPVLKSDTIRLIVRKR